MSGFAGTHPRVEQVYDLGPVLGKGSFSTVYEGTHKVTHERVALKVIPSKNYRHNERAKQLLRTEVAVMSKVRKMNHPNLMHFKHTFEDAEKIVMVLEILSGGELFDRIVKKGHYSEQDASDLTCIIVKALAACHSVGILHRDLKPENCIYTSPYDDSVLKITDFGLAAVVDPTRTEIKDRHLVGTPGYIAPEVLNNYEYSAAADIWAAGVILFILLSGSPPFYGRTHKEIFEKIKAGRWGFIGRNWASVSEGAKDLVKNMLVQDQKGRYTAEQVLNHPWIREHEFLSQAHMPDTLEDLAKFSARQKFKAAAMVCIAGSRLQRVLGVGKQAERLDEMMDMSVFTAEELEKLKTEFGKAMASTGGSSIRLPEFKQVMGNLGFDHLPLERIFKVFDTNGTGDLDYREFLIGVSKFRLRGPDALKFCFDVFDEDGSGAISRDELTKVLVHTRRRSRAQLTPPPPPPPPPGGHSRHSSADSEASSTAAGPMIVDHDDGETAYLVPGPTSTSTTTTSSTASAAAAAGGGGAVPQTAFERTDARYLEMDPDAYEVAEGIAELFDSIDQNRDNQVTFEEFLEGAKRHPELLELFVKPEEQAPRVPTAPPSDLPDAMSTS